MRNLLVLSGVITIPKEKTQIKNDEALNIKT